MISTGHVSCPNIEQTNNEHNVYIHYSFKLKFVLLFITQTCRCNILRVSMVVKMTVFSLNVFLVFAQNRLRVHVSSLCEPSAQVGLNVDQ